MRVLEACYFKYLNKQIGARNVRYRSQHELFPLYKKGAAAHVNNIELGKHGRWRSNVWCYPGASSVSSDSRKGLELHPTVKPTAMLTDAILDLSNRADVVLDPFLGSGTRLSPLTRSVAFALAWRTTPIMSMWC